MDKKIIRDGLIARKNLKHDQYMIDRITKQLEKCNERYDQITQEIIRSPLPVRLCINLHRKKIEQLRHEVRGWLEMLNDYKQMNHDDMLDVAAMVREFDIDDPEGVANSYITEANQWA